MLLQVYYPVRHQLLVHMVNSVQRLAFSTNGTPEQKKLAVDLAEVIVRWEIVRKEDEVSRGRRPAAVSAVNSQLLLMSLIPCVSGQPRVIILALSVPISGAIFHSQNITKIPRFDYNEPYYKDEEN